MFSGEAIRNKESEIPTSNHGFITIAGAISKMFPKTCPSARPKNVSGDQHFGGTLSGTLRGIRLGTTWGILWGALSGMCSVMFRQQRQRWGVLDSVFAVHLSEPGPDPRSHHHRCGIKFVVDKNWIRNLISAAFSKKHPNPGSDRARARRYFAICRPLRGADGGPFATVSFLKQPPLVTRNPRLEVKVAYFLFRTAWSSDGASGDQHLPPTM
jgi:hypothetical protein